MAQAQHEPEPNEQARFRDAIAGANIPTLLMVLVQMTGDLHWLRDPYRPTRTRGLSDNDSGGLDQHLQDRIREAVREAVLAHRAGRPLAIPNPDPDLLTEMLSVCMGEQVPSEYGPLIGDEVSSIIAPAAAVAPRVAAPPDFDVIIVGAGVSGICAAVRLQEAGIPFTIVERNDSVGGVWWENRYPGAGVDTPSHLYSFSFAQNNWSRYFAARDEIHAYFQRVATDFGILDSIRFRTEVLSATYDEGGQRWSVEVAEEDGTTRALSAKIVISAVGAFNKPRVPDIKGLDSFAGAVAHTARWPEDLDVTGKRVVVIGNGASGMQLVPAIADDVASLTIFQRSPQWAVPFEKFQKPVPEDVRFIWEEVPLYRAWYRVRLGWAYNDKIHSTLQKDPTWPHPGRSINQVNDGHRRYFTRHMVSELGDHLELLDSVLPDYPPYGKRILMDNGWFRTLTRDHVHLIKEGIGEVRPEGVVTRAGTVHEADVLVLATGFDVVRFLAPMDIRGRGGEGLRKTWNDDDARAYFGTAVPGFPNFFCLYGPNTQAGHGGSVIFFIEMQMRFVMSLLGQMIDQELGAIECRQDVYDRYNERVDTAHANMIWTHRGMDTYYRNSHGRVVVNNPFRVVDFWHMTRQPRIDDFVTEPAVERVGAGQA